MHFFIQKCIFVNFVTFFEKTIDKFHKKCYTTLNFGLLITAYPNVSICAAPYLPTDNERKIDVGRKV